MAISCELGMVGSSYGPDLMKRQLVLAQDHAAHEVLVVIVVVVIVISGGFVRQCGG